MTKETRETIIGILIFVEFIIAISIIELVLAMIDPFYGLIGFLIGSGIFCSAYCYEIFEEGES